MSISEKLLNAIGLERMTNRDVIMEELAGMTDAEFNRFLDNCPDIDSRLEAICCEECKAQHGGKCPRPDDDSKCSDHFNRVDWLSQPCTHESLITEVEA